MADDQNHGEARRPPRQQQEKYLITSLRGPGGRRLDMHILQGGSTDRRTARVLADPEYARAFLEYIPTPEHGPVSADDLRQELRSAGVRHGIDEAALAYLAERLNAGEKPGLFEVARSTPPRHGDDGSLDFRVRPTSREARYDPDESGSIDFRNLNLIENAVKGQHVATLLPPKSGTPGTDIRGESVRAQDGKPLHVRLGENIYASEDGNRFFAAEDGRLVFDRDRLSLDTIYEVHGDVDYRIGHIRFVGEVIVRGSVLDEFDVCGNRGVTIHGQVGSSRIESDGDVSLLGGMAGKGSGRVRSGGRVSARYLNETEIQAEGDVVIRNEERNAAAVVNSRIRTRGRLSLPGGTLIGGAATALRGVEAAVLGSELGVTTQIAAGIDFTAEQQIEEIDRQLAQWTEKVELADEELRDALHDAQIPRPVAEDQKQLLQDWIRRLQAIRDRLQARQEDRIRLQTQDKLQGQIPQVNVNRLLHPGVVLRFPQQELTIKDACRGPLSVVQDTRHGTPRIVRQTPLAAEPPSEGHKDLETKP